MSLLSRMYLVLLTAVMIVIITLLLIWPDTTIVGWGWGIAQQPPLLRLLAAVVISILLLALLYLQIRPAARASAEALEMRASGTITEVSVDSARERILKVVRDVPDVMSVEVSVRPVRGRAEVDLQVVVQGDEVRLPKKQDEISRALKQVIHKQLGLRLAGRPRIRLRLYTSVAAPSKPAPVSSPTLAAPAGADTLLVAMPDPKPPAVSVSAPAPEPPTSAPAAARPAETTAREPWDAPDVDTIQLAEPVRVSADEESLAEDTSVDLADLVVQAKVLAETKTADTPVVDMEHELAGADLDELVETDLESADVPDNPEASGGEAPDDRVDPDASKPV